MSDPDHTWRQINLWYSDWQNAEHAAVDHLGPALRAAEDEGLLRAWWFIRKKDCWRIRLQPASDDFDQPIQALLGHLESQQLLHRYAEVIYEPETHAFGGPDAIDLAHALFHADSRHLLAHLAGATDLRRELALLLCTRMMRAAGQDWYEQGDIWAQVAAHRPADLALSPATIQNVQALVISDDDTELSPLHHAPAWPAAFENLGRSLSELHQRGQLTRGLRAVLAHHVLFAWNRLGISADHQYLLAASAAQVVFYHQHTGTMAQRPAAPRSN